MKQFLLSVGFLFGFAGISVAQTACAITINKSGTGTNRTYICSSNALNPVYHINLYNTYSNTYGSSSTNSLTVNYAHGGYYYVKAFVTGANGCTDTAILVDTVTGPIQCPAYIDLHMNDSLLTNAYSFYVYYPSPNNTPGYTSSTSYDYGDGTSGSSNNHTYATIPNNTQVVATVSYTHPTQPTCILKDTIYINPANCIGLTHGISYSTPTNAHYQFVSLASTIPGANGFVETRWFFKSPLGISYILSGYGNTLNRTFTNNGLYSLIAVTSWWDYSNNSICTARDTVAVNVTTVTNNLSIQVLVDSTAFFAQLTSPQVKTWLIRKDNVAGTLTAVDSVLSPVVANYIPYSANADFYNIPSGTYLVKSHLINQPAGLSVGYLPTYIYNKASWANADSFVFTGVTNLSKTNKLLSGTPTSGPGFIGGLISAGANRGTAEGDPVAGITVFLRNATGKVLKMATTGADGKYSFNNLATGTYTIYPEELGFSTTASDAIAITSAQSTEGKSYNFKRNTGVKEYIPGVVSLGIGSIAGTAFSVAPNPANNKIQITIGKTTGKVTATLSNITGQVVLQETLTGNTTELDVQQVPAGMYLLQLQNGTEIHTEKVQIQH